MNGLLNTVKMQSPAVILKNKFLNNIPKSERYLNKYQFKCIAEKCDFVTERSKKQLSFPIVFCLKCLFCQFKQIDIQNIPNTMCIANLALPSHAVFFLEHKPTLTNLKGRSVLLLKVIW